jgi:ABC-type dipeptide/oligopeptide/nickel transport system ATPase component
MTISRFRFQDRLRCWKLNDVSFADFNLLVGVSGAGKTKILRSLRTTCQAGLNGTTGVNDCQWEMDVVIEENRYTWAATISTESEKPVFTAETITKNDAEILIRRDEHSFIFNAEALPKLKNTDSAIALLKDEPSLSPLHGTLSRFAFSEDMLLPLLLDEVPFFDIGKSLLGPMPAHGEITELRAKATTLESLRETTDTLLLWKAFVFQELFTDVFQRVKEDYAEIFPTVTDLKIDLFKDMAPAVAKRIPHLADYYALGIKEKGVQGWTVGQQISAGMQRTLVHLLSIALAPSGTVIIVDEIENGMGVNCLPQLIDHFLQRTDLQFILTSHHPYVINNIPWRYWKLVTRKGSEVTVRDATSIPSLDSASSLEKFTQLLNLEEYAEAIR